MCTSDPYEIFVYLYGPSDVSTKSRLSLLQLSRWFRPKSGRWCLYLHRITHSKCILKLCLYRRGRVDTITLHIRVNRTDANFFLCDVCVCEHISILPYLQVRVNASKWYLIFHATQTWCVPHTTQHVNYIITKPHFQNGLLSYIHHFLIRPVDLHA